MSPITHFLAGWALLERTQAERRDGALVVLAGLAPDLDGLGIVVDFATRALGLPETEFYQSYHRVYGHGLPAAVAIAAFLAVLACHRLRVALGAFASVHLHFACDLLGSRGTTVEDNWPITYLAPFSDRVVIEFAGQWPLVSWQNTTITAVLLAAAIALAARFGYSPVGLVSRKGDAAFVRTVRARLERLAGRR